MRPFKCYRLFAPTEMPEDAIKLSFEIWPVPFKRGASCD
jgi:hypothetical protein